MKTFKIAGMLMLVLLAGQVRAQNKRVVAVPMIPSSFAEVIKQVRPSVVNIMTEIEIKGGGRRGGYHSNDEIDEFWQFFFGMPYEEDKRNFAPFKQKGLGSGFIMDESGYILTNQHVVDKATKIKVKLHNGKEYEAKVIGSDNKTDIAVIKIVKGDNNFQAAALGDSDEVEVGDWVVAVGSPFGLDQTATQGIISAKARDIKEPGILEDFFQTDAAINPGNSGGPLVDLKGQVIGINRAIYTNTGTYVGVGFAIPINVAKNVYSQIVKGGKVTRGWLGVSIQELSEELAENFGIKDKKGALVSDVAEAGPADKAGLKSGDVITAFNGKSVQTARELQTEVAAASPGSKSQVTFIRDRTEKTATLTLGERESGEMAFRGTAKNSEKTDEYKIGFSVQDMTPAIREQFGIKSKTGVLVTYVDANGPAAEAGLQRGDILKEVNKRSIGSEKDIEREISKIKAGRPIVLLVEREGISQYISFKSPEKEK